MHKKTTSHKLEQTKKTSIQFENFNSLNENQLVHSKYTMYQKFDQQTNKIYLTANSDNISNHDHQTAVLKVQLF